LLVVGACCAGAMHTPKHTNRTDRVQAARRGQIIVVLSRKSSEIYTADEAKGFKRATET